MSVNYFCWNWANVFLWLVLSSWIVVLMEAPGPGCGVNSMTHYQNDHALFGQLVDSSCKWFPSFCRFSRNHCQKGHLSWCWGHNSIETFKTEEIQEKWGICPDKQSAVLARKLLAVGHSLSDWCNIQKECTVHFVVLCLCREILMLWQDLTGKTIGLDVEAADSIQDNTEGFSGLCLKPARGWTHSFGQRHAEGVLRLSGGILRLVITQWWRGRRTSCWGHQFDWECQGQYPGLGRNSCESQHLIFARKEEFYDEKSRPTLCWLCFCVGLHHVLPTKHKDSIWWVADPVELAILVPLQVSKVESTVRELEQQQKW